MISHILTQLNKQAIDNVGKLKEYLLEQAKLTTNTLDDAVVGTAMDWLEDFLKTTRAAL
jgi:hypothetical protein